MIHDSPTAIAICSYNHIGDFLDHHDVRWVVSIMSGTEWAQFPTPSFGSRKALSLRFDDAGYDSGRLVAPSRDHVASIIDFARAWGGIGLLACHCRAGVSRSSAAAMIVATAIRPSNWKAVASRVVQARAYFTPNTRLLAHADDILGLSPGLVDLVRSLPPPSRIDDWQPVVIPLD